MWQATKPVVALVLGACLSGCASLFSSYDNEFSCKNADHGGCEHPMTAYEKAVAHPVSPPPDTPDPDSVDAEAEAAPVEAEDAYGGYQQEVYAELRNMLQAPVTPVLAPPTTVRTLILPYSNPNRTDRLYMPRFVYSVVETSRFVLGRYLNTQDQIMSLDHFFRAAKPQEKKGE